MRMHVNVREKKVNRMLVLHRVGIDKVRIVNNYIKSNNTHNLSPVDLI